MNKSKRTAQKILKRLTFEPAPLSTNKGRHIYEPGMTRGMSAKDRRHSGHRIVFVEDEAGYVTQFDSYDDWRNWRDGYRDELTKEQKAKIKKKTDIRKAQKVKEKSHPMREK